MRAKFEDRSDIVRDLNNKAILYVNREKLQEYKNKNNINAKYNGLTKEVIGIKNEIKELKKNISDLMNFIKENLVNENGKND